MIVWGFFGTEFSTGRISFLLPNQFNVLSIDFVCDTNCNSEKVLKEFRCLSSVNANGWDVNTGLFLSTEMVTGSGSGMPMFRDNAKPCPISC